MDPAVPTVYPYKNFNALKDAQLLEQAMKGKGCDEQAVIDILCNRTWSQRHEISAVYERQYKKNLISVLKSETSGDFEDVIVTLMQSPAINDAIALKDAVKKKDYEVINAVLFTRSHRQLLEIQNAYNQQFNSNLMEDVTKASASKMGFYKDLLVDCLNGQRRSETEDRHDNAMDDAHALMKAGGPGKTYLDILTRRSFPYLRQVLAAFQQLAKKPFEQEIKDRIKGTADENGYLELIQVIKNKPGFFCDLLISATKGLGTNEKKLNYVLVSRAEIDLATIAGEYQRVHGKTLEKLVESETSGGYKKALLALIHGNASHADRSVQKTETAGHYTATGVQQHLPHSTGASEISVKSLISPVSDSFPAGQDISMSNTMDNSVATRNESRDRPTVYPYKNFNAQQDAQLLEQAMRGKGCDEEAVINILCGRTWRQRQEIAAAYERQYRKNLTSVLKSETSGDFEDVIVTLMQSPAQNDAIMLKDALKTKDHVILNTIAFTRKNEELREIHRLYAEKHGSDLLDDVKKATTGYYEHLLLMSLAGQRDQDNAGSRHDVEGDARALYEAGPKRPGTNMVTYTTIFGRRSFAHLRQVFQAYQQVTKTSIEQTVIDEMKGDDEKGFLALIKVIKNDAEFFVDQIVTATKGAGTNEKKLNHIIVSRAEVDLDTIADAYQRLHKQPLEKLIQAEAKGEYQRALLALVRGNAAHADRGQGGVRDYAENGGQQRLPHSVGSSVISSGNYNSSGSGSYPVGDNSTTLDSSVATRVETRDRPTVYPYKNFNAQQDAQLLEQAMRGKGCDEEAVINILCGRTWRQRQEIAGAYERQYRKNLTSVLKSETSGDFEDVIVTLLQSPALNDAIILKDALKTKDHVILNTIAFTRKNEELREIHRLYAEKHGSSLTEDVKKATTGYYEQLLLLSLAGERDQDGGRHDVDNDARALWEAGPKRPGTNMATFTTIFGRRSYAHLRHVFLRYHIMTKTSIEQTVIDEMKGDDEKGFLALIKVIKNDSEFFCDQIVAATKGAGTNEKKLNHIIVSRAEVDLDTIADSYQRIHKQPLEQLIQAETKGEYQRALLALVRGNAAHADRGLGREGSGQYTEAGGLQRLPHSAGGSVISTGNYTSSGSASFPVGQSNLNSTTLDNSVATRNESRDRPTVYPYKNFNAQQDAQLLEQAMRGQGCDEEAVINILCGRTWRQRQEIAAAYERQYRKSLTSVLKSETSGDFEDVIVTLMQSPAQNDALMLKEAIKNKDHVILNTIAFTRKNEELRDIQRLYNEKHGSNLLEDVKKATTGYYEQLLLLSFAGERDQDNAGSRNDVDGDARALWEAGPKRPGTNMTTFTTIFGRRSFAHLRQVFLKYHVMTKSSIEQTVIDEMKGDDEKGFLALIKVIKNDSEFFCDQIVAATKGAGTNEKKLNHIIVSRAEVDLDTIADTYQRIHKQPLENLIQAEAKGDYQRALLALVRGNAAHADRGLGREGSGQYTEAGGPHRLPHSVGGSSVSTGNYTSPGSASFPAGQNSLNSTTLDNSVATRNESRDRPTVYPYRNFNAQIDAQILEQAMRGKGCDEEAVINILCGRSWRQRQEIAAAYERQYRKNLTSVLKSETSGDFEDVIVTLLQSPAQNDAIMLKEAVKNKDHVILNTIAFTRKNEELREIHRLYNEKHGSNLLDDVKKATTGYYEQLLLLSFAGERDQDNSGSRNDVDGDARALWEAGPKRPGTNMTTFTTIFGRRSFAHLRQVFLKYHVMTKSSIEQTVIDEMKGDDEKGFLALIKVIKNDSEYFVDQIVAATKGAGTNEKKLNHIIVSRAETDLGTIADTYERLHKQPLERLVQAEAKGEYQRALLALVRGNAAQGDRGQEGAGHYSAAGGPQRLPQSTGAYNTSSGNNSVRRDSDSVGQFNGTPGAGHHTVLA